MPANCSREPGSPCLQSGNALLHAATDQEFDRLFPEAVRSLSVTHWSPAKVCRLAAQMLAFEPGVRVLDVGCGPGKFCLIGATTTSGHFTGVEQRSRLVRIARNLIRQHAVNRAEVLHGNITEFSFSDYDAFYLFNPFEENIFPALRIDFDVELAPALCRRYVGHVQQELSRRPLGTRVVTYCGGCSEIPAGYECKEMAFDDRLRLWVKVAAPRVGRYARARTLAEAQIIGRGPCGLVPA